MTSAVDTTTATGNMHSLAYYCETLLYDGTDAHQQQAKALPQHSCKNQLDLRVFTAIIFSFQISTHERVKNAGKECWQRMPEKKMLVKNAEAINSSI